MPTAQAPQVVEGFLKDLLGAKKAIKLYPAGNPLAIDWIQRLHRSVGTALQEGLPPVLRIGPGRFEWDGGQLVTRDPGLEAFRFELQTRRITQIAIDPAVEAWELREFLDCLNLAHQDIDAAGGLPALLRQRNVVHIELRGPLFGDSAGGPEGAGLWGDSGGGEGTAVAAAVGAIPFDVLEGLAAAIVEMLAHQLRDLTYDRQRLSAWFIELAHPGDRAEVVFSAIEMLIPVADAESDREIRYRTLAESITSLPDPLRGMVVGTWLLPRAWTPHVINLLTRFSGDEFAELTGLVSASVLQELRAELELLPCEEWLRARLRESLDDALAAKEAAEAPLEPLVADDDPGLVGFGQATQAACAPDKVLTDSVSILFQMLGATETEGYPVFLVDALEEATAEALSRDQLGLALLILRSLGNADQLRPEWTAEHQRRVHLLQARLAGRASVSLLTDYLRRGERPHDVRDAAEYLQMLGREATDEFIGILADMPDERARARMLEVVTTIGPAAVPALRVRVNDSRWAIARSIVAALARIGDPAAFQALEKVARHEHAQVRREVVRALAALGGKQAVKPLLGYLSDPDGDVRLTAIKLLGTLMDAGAVTLLREFLTTPTRTVADLLGKREIISALASVGSPEARQVLESIARRRVWPWQRNEQKVRALALEATKTMAQAPAVGEPSRG